MNTMFQINHFTNGFFFTSLKYFTLLFEGLNDDKFLIFKVASIQTKLSD